MIIHIFIIVFCSGDPRMFEAYWEKMRERSAITLAGSDSLSYFSKTKNMCWYLEPKLEEEIRRLHTVVGNAVVEDHYIVVGTGSSQLIQAALYALSLPASAADHPITVVCAAPYYSVGITIFITIYYPLRACNLT